MVCRHRGHLRGDACQRWLDSIEMAGVVVVVPEIADYEVRRELTRRGSRTSLTRLDYLATRLIYQPITTSIMRRAAEFWADLRRRGLPTTADSGLDADAILAAQADLIGNPGDVVTVATSNARHLARFPGIDAREWSSVAP
ncbi:MAG: type II toxin-antitoxin system VapC family toxin [Isosphaeraceae bacterium]